jgi:hypothetical protein
MRSDDDGADDDGADDDGTCRCLAVCVTERRRDM